MHLGIRTVRRDTGKSLDVTTQVKEMISVPRSSLTVTSIIITDVLALFMAISITVVARLILGGSYSLVEYARLWPMIGIFLAAFAFAGLYPGVPVNPVSELRRVFSAVTVVFLIFGVFIFLSHSAELWSRGVFLAACPISAVFVVSARSALRHALASKDWWGMPAIVVGAGQTGQLITETLSKLPWIGLKVIAVLDEKEESIQNWKTPGRFVVGGLDLINQLTRDRRVTYGIVAMQQTSSKELIGILEQHCNRFHHILLIPDLFGLSSLWVTAQDIGGLLGLEIRQTLLQRWPQFLKRVLDLIITTFGGLLLVPLCLMICLAIKLTSPGPVVYGQRRIGRGNRHFTAWKFRTMVADADALLNLHLASKPNLMAEWQRDHKLRKDPRITPIGRILRCTSLDELPQLWNVLCGEMSLVGPRPIVDAEVLKYGNRFRLYCRVRPGITGLWQVSGRSDTGYDKRIQFDEYYVRNWSVWLDLYLLGRTLGTIARCNGAY